MPSPATFRATGPPLRAWGGDLLPLGPFWIMCSGIGVLGLAGGGEPWMLPLLLGVMAVVSPPPG